MPHCPVDEPSCYIYPEGELDSSIISAAAIESCIEHAEACCPDGSDEAKRAHVYACAYGKYLHRLPQTHVTMTRVDREGTVRRDSLDDIYKYAKQRWKYWLGRACDLGCCCGLEDPDDVALRNWPHVIGLR